MIVYILLIRIYGLIIRAASVRNKKARQWVNGRKNWQEELSRKISKTSNKRVWVHCASYGEFEQGRPLMEAIKQKHPDHSIVLSFFSPSGYEAFKNWDGAEVICYLPLDTQINARQFLDIVKPQTAVFIKYEFWINFLFELKKKNIPTFLVSAVFKPHHPFFRWYGGIFKRSLATFNELFIQDDNSGKLLDSIGIKNYEVCGDTRFDRVLDIKDSFKPIPFFEAFSKNKQLIIGGSTWPKDDELLIEAFKEINDPTLKLVLVPHNVDAKSIANVEQLLQKHELNYSLYSRQEINPLTNVLIVDAMGLLSKLYHYADVAYIGGGFNSGIHNCLEPAVYLKPIVFYGGDDYHKYNEAVDLLKMKVAKNVSDVVELKNALIHFLNDPQHKTEEQLRIYFAKNSGTTKKVMALINWD